MQMKKAAFGLLVLAGISSCTPKVYQSLDWQTKQVVADGKVQEWTIPLRFYDDKTKINYTITNDQQNLYLCMKVMAPETQLKILRGGIEFRVDTLGGTKYPISFSFPLAGQPSMPGEPRGGVGDAGMNGHPNKDSFRQHLVEQAQEAELVGFKRELNGMVHVHNNPYGISAAISIDNAGMMYYEAVIPFHTFYRNALSKDDASRVFGFMVQVNGVSQPMKHEGESGEGSSNRYMGGRGMYGNGGGMGGGRRGGGMHGEGFAHGNVDMSSASKLELKMKLSVH